MTKVAILPIPTASGEMSYHALAGKKQSQGRTAGEALDALTIQLPDKETDTLVIVQYQRPDSFFDEAKQQRLGALMAKWRERRDSGGALSAEEQAELDGLVESEIEASSERTAAMLRDLAR